MTFSYRILAVFISQAYPGVRIVRENLHIQSDYYIVHLACDECGEFTAKYHYDVVGVGNIMAALRPMLRLHLNCSQPKVDIATPGKIRKISLE